MMDLLRYSRPSWDMKEVAYNHRSMQRFYQFSQTFVFWRMLQVDRKTANFCQVIKVQSFEAVANE